MKNKVQLITYVNRILRDGTIKDLHALLEKHFAGCFGTIHILPFYYPVDGADAGFDPIDHTQVDPRLGTWEDIRALSGDFDVMADVIVNHISDQSPQFRDYRENGDGSPFAELFLDYSTVFPDGASEQELLQIYRPRPGMPFTAQTLADGIRKLCWTTFTPHQLDINAESAAGKAYLDNILVTCARAGVRSIRLDAAGYAIKRAGTSCFMIPETFAFIEQLSARAHQLGIEVLVEIHSYYRDQIEIARQVDRVYDFALPPLVLHAIFHRTARYLKKWFEISPRNCLTVLDTHDGIGVIDIGPGKNRKEQPGLIPDGDLDALVEEMHTRSRGESRRATGAAASNLDLYQVTCTCFDALGRDSKLYLLARAIQFFAPGIPQVYYVGLLCGENDMELLGKTNVGRDINRHYFTPEEMELKLQAPCVQKLVELIRFRNTHPAFDGEFSIAESDTDELLTIIWRNQGSRASLIADFRSLEYRIDAT
jgi:sucrose phosphorylase